MSTKQTFIEAYDRYAEAIYRHCYFRVFSKAKAEECTQETFLRVWEYLGKGEKVENIRAFLYRVANNLLIDESRKKKEMSLDAMMTEFESFEPSYDGGKSIEKTMATKEIIKEFRTLNDDDRALLAMRYIDEMEPREIAEALGDTPNNVSVKIHRALAKIKKKVSE